MGRLKEIKINPADWKVPDSWNVAKKNHEAFLILNEIDFGHHLTKQSHIPQMSIVFDDYAKTTNHRSINGFKEYFEKVVDKDGKIIARTFKDFRKYVGKFAIPDELLRNYILYSLFKYTWNGFEAETLIINDLGATGSTVFEDNVKKIDFKWNNKDYQVKTWRQYQKVKDWNSYKDVTFVIYYTDDIWKGIFKYEIMD